ncbi:MAG: hypothetical protein ACXW3S_11315 [Rhodoplanes sp.]
MTFVIDPRRGDAEDDASSTKQRSMLSLAGSLLAEISLPKLVVVWVLLVGGPAVLIGTAPAGPVDLDRHRVEQSGLCIVRHRLAAAICRDPRGHLVWRTPSLADGRGELLVAQFYCRAARLCTGPRTTAPFC